MHDCEYVPVEEDHIDETVRSDYEPPWVAELRRSQNALHRRVDALYRKVDNMTPVDLSPLEAAMTGLEEKNGLVETAVTQAGGELVALKVETEKLEQQVATSGDPALEASVQRILDRVGGVSGHLTTAASTLTADVAAAEAPAAGAAGSGAGAPAGEVAGGTAPLPLYTFTGDPASIDAATWVKTNVQTSPEGAPLYTNTHDVGGQPASGVVADVWTQYTGPTEAVPAPGTGTPGL